MTKKKPQLAVKRYDDEIFLQPWFVPKDLFLTFRRMLPSCQLLKMRYYFDDYGCIKCGRRQVRYGHNGFCRTCGRMVTARVILALKRRFRKFLGVPVPTAPIDNLLFALDTAHGLRLDELARHARLEQWHRTGKYVECRRGVERSDPMPTYKRPRTNPT
jgi:hypothetical protein